ncbi:TPA: hypothetical protein QEM96_000016 [Pseudomonas putida]|nr:hypothetical protein [Pseudomonas putida]
MSNDKSTDDRSAARPLDPCGASDNVQHLVGTRYVPSVEAYILEMTGARTVGKRRPTLEARFCEVEYDLVDGTITGLTVAP